MSDTTETLFEPHVGSHGVGTIKDARRCRITNGSAFLPGIDGRSVWVRRAKDLNAQHVADLGGPDNVSAAERSITRRIAVLSVELENLEARFANAGSASAVDLDLYQRVANTLRRLLEAVGIARRPRDITTPDALHYSRDLNIGDDAS